MIRTRIVIAVVAVACLTAGGAPPPQLAGTWTFDSAQGKNLGMMASMKIHTNIVQSQSELTVDDASDFNGQQDVQHTVYDLTGKPVSNTPVMGGTATTSSRWEGDRLVTEWKSPGSIAGTTVTRIETRYLSPDGNTMYVESSRSGRDLIVMVFTRDR